MILPWAVCGPTSRFGLGRLRPTKGAEVVVPRVLGSGFYVSGVFLLQIFGFAVWGLRLRASILRALQRRACTVFPKAAHPGKPFFHG